MGVAGPNQSDVTADAITAAEVSSSEAKTSIGPDDSAARLRVQRASGDGAAAEDDAIPLLC